MMVNNLYFVTLLDRTKIWRRETFSFSKILNTVLTTVAYTFFWSIGKWSGSVVSDSLQLHGQ